MTGRVLPVAAAIAAATIGCTNHDRAGNQAGAAGSTVVGAAGAMGGAAGAAGVAGASGAAGASPIGSGGATSGAAGATGSGGAAGAAGASGSGGATAGTTGSGGTTAGAAGATGGAGTSGAGGSIAFYPLDMNDVTILAPLPPSNAAPVLLNGSDLADDGTALVPRALFDRLAASSAGGSPVLGGPTYDRLQLVAVRFDLCDRHLPGACPETEDARMRLVFQPLFTGGLAEDVGFHAFYTIRNDEIAGAVAALRDLAMIAPPQSGMLRVSPALSAANPEPYATKVRGFVKRYGGDARIVRLTLNAQPETSEQVRWVLRGVEKEGDAFVDITMVGSTATSETVVVGGGPSYDVTPVADTPPGLQGAIVSTMFGAADATAKSAYVAALAAVENPLSHTAETVPCVACHVSTVITSNRAAALGTDPLAIPGRYTSTFDLSIAGGQSAQTPQTLRALGYLGAKPMISQRVVNDTAQTLVEIEARYPGH
jgi:hypothetical protein